MHFFANHGALCVVRNVSIPSPPAHRCGGNKKVLGTDASPDDALSVARFYEQQHELGKAGKFYR